jgi:hypothetical protein
MHTLKLTKDIMKGHPLPLAILSSFSSFLIANVQTTELLTIYLKFIGAIFGTVLSIWFVAKEVKKWFK